ncbi:1-acyl-sn-glycerol-3-phosphate acyltransferase [Gammaproteobacteria bacterium]|nr:1-acyl-sn-glycerol-3-phosphate acyltransferase [Gammaproteobacteria bacterium]
MKILGSVLFNIAFYISLVLICTSILVLRPFLTTLKLQNFASFWIKFLLFTLRFFCGVSWEVEGLSNIPNEPCIVVSNHQGQWESLFIQTLIIPNTSIVKRELLLIPFFGWALRCMRPITLNRANKLGSLKKVIRKGVEKINEGYSVILFPEGTRISPDEGIQKFANSCGVLSVKSGVSVIPICHNSGRFWKNKKFIKEPGKITVRIGAPIKGSDAKEITKQSYEWVRDTYQEIN